MHESEYSRYLLLLNRYEIYSDKCGDPQADFSLENKSAFVNAVEKYAVMKQEEFQNAVEKAHQYAIDVSNSKAKNTGYRTIFEI